MPFVGASGKLRFLRVNDLGHVYGSPDDAIFTEVTCALEGQNHAFGFTLKLGDDNLPSQLAMLSILRDAYVHNLTVGVAYDIVEGKNNGALRRVELSR